jgi:hypothetical protein
MRNLDLLGRRLVMTMVGLFAHSKRSSACHMTLAREQTQVLALSRA